MNKKRKCKICKTVLDNLEVFDHCLKCYKRYVLPKIKPKSVFFVTSLSLRKISSYSKCEPNYYKHLLKMYGGENGLKFDNRTWGWYPTFKIADEWVTKNSSFYYECGYYRWICIEEIPFGTCPYKVLSQHFYEWQGNEDEGGFVDMGKWPDELEKYFDDEHLVKIITTIG